MPGDGEFDRAGLEKIAGLERFWGGRVVERGGRFPVVNVTETDKERGEFKVAPGEEVLDAELSVLGFAGDLEVGEFATKLFRTDFQEAVCVDKFMESLEMAEIEGLFGLWGGEELGKAGLAGIVKELDENGVILVKADDLGEERDVIERMIEENDVSVTVFWRWVHFLDEK